MDHLAKLYKWAEFGGGGRDGTEINFFKSFYAEQWEEFSGCQHEFGTKVWFKM